MVLNRVVSVTANFVCEKVLKLWMLAKLCTNITVN